MASGTIAIAVAIMMGLCVCGPAIAQGMVASKTMESIARQPEAAGQLRSSMILALGLIEALTIYGLLIAFMLVGKI
ncbi:MAG: ATP synthase F0 subunit C [Candidatus Limivicinus sp.]|nr:ATP synthase F0 subunit C [Candidatus Limivicinus sp.]